MAESTFLVSLGFFGAKGFNRFYYNHLEEKKDRVSVALFYFFDFSLHYIKRAHLVPLLDNYFKFEIYFQKNYNFW